MKNVPENLNAHPSVFAVGDRYQIITPFECEAVVSIRVGDKMFYDDSNGILRSGSLLHRVEVPMQILDKAGEYTLIYRKMIDRKPYFPESEPPAEITYKFRPVRDGNINIYLIADAHNMETAPINAGRHFGEELDLLVLAGDIPNHSGDIKNFNSIYRIVSGITGGERPAVFARGNHDTRGIYAEEFSKYTPCDNGKPYYTFRLGSVWGLVLDCGEDKDDSHPEYGNTVCFHDFRLRQTDFICDVIANAENEYAADGVKHKLVICHIPFIKIAKPPFDIEQPLYREWTRMMAEDIKPELLLFGHTHKCGVYEPQGEYDSYKLQPCTAVIVSEPDMKEKSFVGCALTLKDDGFDIGFNRGYDI